MCQKAENRFHAWSTCVYVVCVTSYAPEHARLRLTPAVCDPLRPRIASDPAVFRFGLLEALLRCSSWMRFSQAAGRLMLTALAVFGSLPGAAAGRFVKHKIGLTVMALLLEPSGSLAATTPADAFEG